MQRLYFKSWLQPGRFDNFSLPSASVLADVSRSMAGSVGEDSATSGN